MHICLYALFESPWYHRKMQFKGEKIVSRRFFIEKNEFSGHVTRIVLCNIVWCVGWRADSVLIG